VARSAHGAAVCAQRCSAAARRERRLGLTDTGHTPAERQRGDELAVRAAYFMHDTPDHHIAWLEHLHLAPANVLRSRGRLPDQAISACRPSTLLALLAIVRPGHASSFCSLSGATLWRASSLERLDYIVRLGLNASVTGGIINCGSQFHVPRRWPWLVAWF